MAEYQVSGGVAVREMEVQKAEEPKTVLVTGASGFLGRACVERLLAAGHQVQAVSTRVRQSDHPRLVWHKADLTDSEVWTPLMSEAGASHLLHMAWRPVSGDVWRDEGNYRWAEIGRGVAESFYAAGGVRVVGCGSCGEYEWGDEPCVEEITPLNPATHYGKAKLRLCESLREVALGDESRSSAWGRVFFVYGPHEHPKRLVSSVIRSLIRGVEAPCSHGRQVRDYLHSSDVADGLVELLFSKADGAYNIASGQGLRLMDILRTIGEITDHGSLIRLGAIEAAAHEPAIIVGSSEKMFRATGWRAVADLRADLEQTVQWWRQEASLETEKSGK